MGHLYPATREGNFVNAGILNGGTVRSNPATVPRAASLAGWAVAAVLLGCVLALSGLPGIYATLVLALVVVFAAIALRYPAFTMGASIWLLALVPFSWGITTGVLPKLFGDECLLLVYLVVLPLLYLSRSRTWRPSPRNLYWALGLFLVAQALSLAAGTDLVAFRNLLETDLLGPFLLLLFLQESANTPKMESLANAIVWLTVILAALSVIERLTQRNPIMEHFTDFTYLSPTLAALTNGVYRPYVTFFHPSDAGTFMAFGVPFALRRWLQTRSWFSLLLLATIAVGIFVNATRGVWVAVAVATLLLARRPLLILLCAIPVASSAFAIAYLALKSTPFIQRLTDPNNLYSRLVYWALALKVFASHPVLGVGHMQFQKVYLNYVHDLSNVAHFDIAKIFAIDNMYLTTLVEHGIVGLFALVGILIFFAVSLSALRRHLLVAQLDEQASFVRAVQLILVICVVAGCFADIDQFTKSTKFFFILIGLGYGVGARALYVGSLTPVPEEHRSIPLEPTSE
jgi:O-antigen ligase